MREIFCVKLQKSAEGLDRAPYPGAIGQRIYDHISKEAWKLWVNHQTMLINEYRLNMLEAKDRQLLVKEMEKFLFGEGSEAPEGYKAPNI